MTARLEPGGTAGQRARLAESLVLCAVFVVLGLLVAYLNRAHLEQQENYISEYVRMADHYRGVKPRAVLTYPMWGYSIVLLTLPRYDLVAVPQVLLASVVATVLFVALRAELPQHGRSLAVLFVVAVPWYLLHSVKWPQSFAASFCVLGLVVLARAFHHRSVALGAAAGLAFGAALYFRSEFLYLPLFVVCVAIAAHLVRRQYRAPVLPAVVAALVAWAALIPWAVHYHRETGRYSLTASQRGIVAFISLGQLPGNPWGATYLDEYAYDYLAAKGISVIPQSDSGDRVLFDEFKRRVRERPAAFVKKMVWNAATTLAGGFYSGEIPLSSTENEQLSRLRSDLRGTLMPAAAAPGDSLQTQSTVRPRVYGALIYWVLAKAIGALFITVGFIGLAIALWRGIRTPVLFVAAVYVAYQFLLLLALATEPRYLNGLYLALAPFAIITVHAAVQAVRHRRGDGGVAVAARA